MRTTYMALDAEMPLIRPDSYAFEFVPGLWNVHTPSTGTKAALFMEEDMEVVKAEFAKIGKVVEVESEKNPGKIWKLKIEGPLKDADWWKHRAEDGMLGSLDLSAWGIEVSRGDMEGSNK